VNAQKRSEIFSLLKKSIPEAKTELLYNSPFQLLIAVILSAQATDISVNKATQPLFANAGTAKKLSELSLNEIELYIKTIGLYKTKAAA
jgi:endonuclease III